LVLATILFSAQLFYSTKTLNSVKADLYTAKQEAFNSLNTLWSARSEAYNARSLQSLYLLHNGTGIVQSADTINFNFSADRMSGDGNSKESNSIGFLTEALNNITFQGEEQIVKAASQQWAKYVDMDKQIRNLEYDSKHNEAISLFVGASAGQSNYQFGKFDAELGKVIDINQANFDSNMNSVYRTLSIFPYVTLVFLVLIILFCIFGLKPRIEEYRA
jgi:hypothetical protein